MQTPDSTANGLANLDKLLEHRSRLGTCVMLADTDAMSFTNLKKLLKETDGNMGAHMRKLEEANYVTVKKEFQNRKPVTWYALSTQGRHALKAHLDALQSIIQNSGLT